MPNCPRTEEMLMTRPPSPCSTIWRTAAWVGRSVLRTLSSMIQSQSSPGYSWASCNTSPAPPPMALTMMSTLPNSATVSFDGPLGLFGVGGVGRDRHSPPTGSGDLGRGPIGTLLRSSHHGDGRSGIGQALRQRRSDGASPAGDDRNPSAEVEHLNHCSRPSSPPCIACHTRSGVSGRSLITTPVA